MSFLITREHSLSISIHAFLMRTTAQCQTILACSLAKKNERKKALKLFSPAIHMTYSVLSSPFEPKHRKKKKQVNLCVHGHFYQPPRFDPYSNLIPNEPGAEPHANFNERITAECYRPLAEAGTFSLMSFDLGPTLAAWLETAHPDVYQAILAADSQHYLRHGVGNAMAQPFNHTILPLATRRDKLTQIRWGLLDFRHRFARDAHGMWLAETAVDTETLDLLAQEGITYTILAPWQINPQVDPTEPYWVPLKSGRRIAVFVYNNLSGAVSYDDSWTVDANEFAKRYMESYRHRGKDDQLHLIASDGELYGHHKPGRNDFLDWLLNYSAPAHGFEVSSPERFLLDHPPTQEARIVEPSSWSCQWHGVARWGSGCGCTEGDASWKPALRQALTNLSEQGDRLFERATKTVLTDPWQARDEYLLLRNGWIAPERYWRKHAKGTLSAEEIRRTTLLFEAQFYQQYSFTSCGFFFEDLDRLEPQNNIAFARRAISLHWEVLGVDLQGGFLRDLAAARSWRTQATGADLYRRLPPVSANALPPLSR